MPISPETPPLRQPVVGRSRGYILPMLLMVVGALFLWQGGSRITAARSKNSIRIDAPEEKTFQIGQPGEYRLWVMKHPAAGGVSHGTPPSLPPGARVELTHVPEGRVIRQQPMKTSMRMSVSGIQRVALGTFMLPDAAEYRITASGSDRRYVLLLDEASAFWQFFAGIFFVVIGAAIFPAALVLGIVASRSHRGERSE